MVIPFYVTYGNTYCLFQMATFLYLGGYRNNPAHPRAPPPPCKSLAYTSQPVNS